MLSQVLLVGSEIEWPACGEHARGCWDECHDIVFYFNELSLVAGAI